MRERESKYFLVELVQKLIFPQREYMTTRIQSKQDFVCRKKYKNDQEFCSKKMKGSQIQEINFGPSEIKYEDLHNPLSLH